MSTSLASSKVVVRSGVYNFLGFIVSACYLIVLIPVLVHFIGIEQFGLWSLMVALTGFLGLADLGMGMSFVKFIAEHATRNDYGKMNAVIQHGLIFYLVVAAVVFVTGYLLFPALASLLNIPGEKLDLAHTVMVLALTGFGVTGLSHVFGSVLSALQRMDAYNLLVIGMLVAKFIAIYSVLAAGYGLPGMMAADLAVTVFTFIPLIVVTRRVFPMMSLRMGSFDGALMKQLLAFGSQLQLARLGEMVQLQFDKILLTRYIGLTAVSLYDFGSRPLVRLRALPLTVIQSLVPAVSALDADENPARIRAAFLRATRYLIVVALPLFTFLTVYAHEIIQVWLGVQHEWAAVTMQIFGIAYFVNVVGSVLGFVSHGKGEPKYQMQAMLIQGSLNIFLSVVLLLLFGYFGAVTGTAISMIVGTTVFVYRYGRRVVENPLHTFLALGVKPLVSIAPAVAVSLSLTWLLSVTGVGESRIELTLLLCISGLALLTVYGLMLYWTRTFNEDDKGFVMGVLPERLRRLAGHPT
jgi:O-antigen/teichoic acid export membrane protein